MYCILYVFGASFDIVPQTDKEAAIEEVKNHFLDLIKKNNYDYEEDEAFVMESTGAGKSMKCVYSTKEDPIFKEENLPR